MLSESIRGFKADPTMARENLILMYLCEFSPWYDFWMRTGGVGQWYDSLIGGITKLRQQSKRNLFTFSIDISIGLDLKSHNSAP